MNCVKNTNNREYVTPAVEVLTLLAENFTLASSLEDYEDNPIFGAPIDNNAIGL